jgi:DNA-3-methyladenine glycosylase
MTDTLEQSTRNSFPSFLSEDSLSVARKLLGCIIERTIDGRTIQLKIVETESYDETDAASHSYKGRTPRTDVMFGPSGRLYVYFTYGMHYCCNVVCGVEGIGEAVLIRAVEPLDHIAYLERIRGQSEHNVTNGPAKLCTALSIDKQFNGHDLRWAPIRLLAGVPVDDADIVVAPRIGISKNRDAKRRFYITNNPYVSRIT